MNGLVLPDRLKAVAAMLTPCETLADIGTDHAYIPIYSVMQGIAKRAAAVDIVDGPLKIASENIEKYGLTDKISIIKSDGLKSVPASEVIVIAGMGGLLIGDIIAASKAKAEKARCLVLQPMTCTAELRRSLHNIGFAIIKEKLAFDSKKLYNIIIAAAGNEEYGSEADYLVGKYLIDNRDPLLADYINYKIKVLSVKLDNMKNSKTNVDAEINDTIRLRSLFCEVGDAIGYGRADCRIY